MLLEIHLELHGTMDNYAQWMEMQALVQERYPDMPYEEAYFKFLLDQKEVAEKYLLAILSQLQQAPELVEAYGVYVGSPSLQAWGRVAGLFRRYLQSINTSSAVGQNITVDNATGTTLGATIGQAAASSPIGVMAGGPEATGTNTGNATIEDSGFVAKNVDDIHVIGKSLVDRLDYYRRWAQTVSAIRIAQEYTKIKILSDISNRIAENNTVAVSGSGGSAGFAQHVYDFIRGEIDKIGHAQRRAHRIFVFSPDTNWYPAFHRLIRQHALPPIFCAKSDDLDALCLYMLDVREQLKSELAVEQDVIFHLLIPSWYCISIKEPLHFPDALQPLQVVTLKHKGKALVEMNLPQAPAGMLRGVANVLDPNGSNKLASCVSVGTTLPVVGWGVNGVCLAVGVAVGSATGLGMLIGAPIWAACSMPAMMKTAPMIEDAVYDALCEEPARILGSDGRLEELRPPY